MSRIKKIYAFVKEYLKDKKLSQNPALHPLDTYQENIKNQEIKEQVQKIWAQHKERIYYESQIPHSFDCKNMMTCRGCAIYEAPKVTKIETINLSEIPIATPREDIFESKEERIVTALSDNAKLQEEFFSNFVPDKKKKPKKERKKHKNRMVIEFPGVKNPKKRGRPSKKQKSN